MSQRFDLVAISSGDRFREEMKAGTETGRAARQYVDGGQLVPDEIVLRIMLAGIRGLPGHTGWILDGFPRTVPQAEALDQALGRGAAIQAVVDFHMSDAEIVARILARRVCTQCGRTYNTRFLPPRRADVCDTCGGKVTQRADDREDVIVTRLETYRSETVPLLDYYGRRKLLQTVDASAPPDRVESAVAGIVASLKDAE